MKRNLKKFSIKDIDIFSDLNSKNKTFISAGIKMVPYQKSQFAFQEGEVAKRFFYILSGKVKLYKQDSSGKVHLIRIAKKNDILDYSCLANQGRYHYTAEIMEDSMLVTMDKPNFERVLSWYPSVTNKLLTKLGTSIYCAEEKVFQIVNQSIEKRLAKLFLDLIDDFGKPANEGVFLDIHLSREEMAQSIGSTRETITRIISKFKNSGLMEVQGKKINILSPQKMESIVNDVLKT